MAISQATGPYAVLLFWDIITLIDCNIFSGINNQLGDLDTDYQELVQQKKAVEAKFKHLEEEKFDMNNDVEKQKSLVNEKDREMEQLQKEYEYAKDREAVLMGDRWVK